MSLSNLSRQQNALDGITDASSKMKTFVSRSLRPAFELGLVLLTKFSKIGIRNLNMLWLVRPPESSIAAVLVRVHATA